MSRTMRRTIYYALIGGIVIFVMSMALLWRDNTASEDSDALTTWASAIFLVFVVCGPGLLAKQVFGMLVPVEELAKNRRRLLRESKRAEEIRVKAVAAKTRIQNWYAWYVQESGRMRSIYLLAYREASGKNTTRPRELKVENPYQS